MSKTFETSVEIKGEIGQSFVNSFRKATDGMSDLQREARLVQREIDRLGDDFRRGKIHQSQYAEETRKLTNELDKLQRKQKLIETVKSKGSNIWNSTKAVASIGAIATAAAGTAVAIKSLNVAADFEYQMSTVAAKTEATSSEMKALTATALELGAKTSLSASESAIAMDSLAARGMNVNQIISAMPGIIAGAEASGEDLALVSDTVGTALSVWGLEAQQASKVADVLAKSANISAASVMDFSYAFKYAGKPAADLNQSLEATAAAISVMVDSGLEGSSAGTSLRSSLLNLASPTKKQADLLKKLNVSMKDAKGNAKPLAKVIGELDKATKNMTNIDKTATLETLVGTEAVSGFLALMAAGETKLNDMTKQLEQSVGSAAKASKVMMDNYAGAKEQMLGAIESAQIAGASPALEVLKRTFDGISGIIEANIPQIEAAGQSVANVLEEILSPFIYANEPIKPVIDPQMDPDYIDLVMLQYEKDVAKYNLFGKMDMGDKVDYMLDQTVDHVSKWVEGDGGEALKKLFGELAVLAGSTWATSFSTIVKSAMSELGEGDIGTALALGAGANAMTGGLLLAGGLAGGKYVAKKGKSLIKGKGAKVTTAPNLNTTTIAPTTGKGNKTAANKAKNAVKSTKNVNSVTKSAKATPAISKLGKASKYLGKAALPISLATGLIGVATSDNKGEAVGSLGGSLAGGAAGAKAGAVIGTFIAPGIGTAVGGALGGLVGSIGGSILGSKAGNAVAKPASTSTNVDTANKTAVSQITTSANTVKTNLDALAKATLDASQGIAAINNIATAARAVEAALKNMEQRIRNSSIHDTVKSVNSGARVAYV